MTTPGRSSAARFSAPLEPAAARRATRRDLRRLLPGVVVAGSTLAGLGALGSWVAERPGMTGAAREVPAPVPTSGDAAVAALTRQLGTDASEIRRLRGELTPAPVRPSRTASAGSTGPAATVTPASGGTTAPSGTAAPAATAPAGGAVPPGTTTATTAAPSAPTTARPAPVGTVAPAPSAPAPTAPPATAAPAPVATAPPVHVTTGASHAP